MTRGVVALVLLVMASSALAGPDLRKVRVFNAPPTQPHEVLGSITAEEDDFVEAVDALKEEALEMGGDAIVITAQQHKDRKLFRSGKEVVMADVIKTGGSSAKVESASSPPKEEAVTAPPEKAEASGAANL